LNTSLFKVIWIYVNHIMYLYLYKLQICSAGIRPYGDEHHGPDYGFEKKGYDWEADDEDREGFDEKFNWYDDSDDDRKERGRGGNFGSRFHHDLEDGEEWGDEGGHKAGWSWDDENGGHGHGQSYSYSSHTESHHEPDHDDHDRHHRHGHGRREHEHDYH